MCRTAWSGTDHLRVAVRRVDQPQHERALPRESGGFFRQRVRVFAVDGPHPHPRVARRWSQHGTEVAAAGSRVSPSVHLERTSVPPPGSSHCAPTRRGPAGDPDRPPLCRTPRRRRDLADAAVPVAPHQRPGRVGRRAHRTAAGAEPHSSAGASAPGLQRVGALDVAVTGVQGGRLGHLRVGPVLEQIRAAVLRSCSRRWTTHTPGLCSRGPRDVRPARRERNNGVSCGGAGAGHGKALTLHCGDHLLDRGIAV